MIRNALFGISLLALTSATAFAAPATKHHVAKVRVMAEAPAPAADTTAPVAAKAEKKAKKSTKKDTAGKTEGAKEIKAPQAPSASAPVPATK